jgi:hypothetical protein
MPPRNARQRLGAGHGRLGATERLFPDPRMVADSNPLKSLPIRFPYGTVAAERGRGCDANSE